ncbi:MAG: beta-propeller fold lactonase family protein, partial [Abitibacteriaceae bacterium]|nr:beta-propeller fold lactonase family protein [Abditibacteriaceae bacterium]
MSWRTAQAAPLQNTARQPLEAWAPRWMALNEITHQLFVVNQASETVSVIDTAAATVTAIVPVGMAPEGIAVNPSNNKVYVANLLESTVSVIDGNTLTLLHRITLENGARSIAVNAKTNKIYVTNAISDSISVIDGDTDTVTATVEVAALPYLIAVNPSNNRIYVTLYSTVKSAHSGSITTGPNNKVQVVNGTDNKVVATIQTGFGPRGVAIDTVRNRIYVANEMSNSVTVINGVDNSVTRSIPVGKQPVAVAVAADINQIYVTNLQGHTISRISGGNDTGVTTTSAGQYPFGLAVDTKTDRVYVSDTMTNSIRVIEADTQRFRATISVAMAHRATPLQISNLTLKGTRPMLALQTGHSGAVDRLAYSPDGQTVLTSSSDQTTRLWDAATGQLKAILPVNTSSFRSGLLAFSPNSKFLAIVHEHDVLLWDVGAGHLRGILQGHKEPVKTVVFAPDSKNLATSDGLSTFLWTVPQGQRTVLTAPGFSHGLAFASKGKRLAILSTAGLYLWNVSDGHLDGEVALENNPHHGFSPNGSTLAIAEMTTGNVQLWDVLTGRLTATLQNRTQRSVSEITFSPNGRMLLTSGQAGAWLWDLTTKRLKATLLNTSPYSTVFSPDSQVLVLRTPSIGRPNLRIWDDLRIWDVTTGRLKYILTARGNGLRLSSPIFSTNSKTLAIRTLTAGNAAVQLWDSGAGLLEGSIGQSRLPKYLDPLKNVDAPTLTFSPNGKAMAIGGVEYGFGLWDITTRRLIHEINHQSEAVDKFAQSANSVLSLDNRGSVRLWDISLGRPRFTIHTHGLRGAVALSPDGTLFAVVTYEDSTWTRLKLQLREVATGRLRSAFRLTFNKANGYYRRCGDRFLIVTDS